MRLIFSAVLMCVGFVLIGYSIWTFFILGVQNTRDLLFSVFVYQIYFLHVKLLVS
jgi:hypothetical protein